MRGWTRKSSRNEELDTGCATTRATKWVAKHIEDARATCIPPCLATRLVIRTIGSDWFQVIAMNSDPFYSTSSEITFPKLQKRKCRTAGTSSVMRFVHSLTSAAVQLSGSASCMWCWSAFSTFFHSKNRRRASLCSYFRCRTSIAVADDGIVSSPRSVPLIVTYSLSVRTRPRYQ